MVYNNVHMMMYEADEAKRESWIASIDAVAALNPKIVVAGHKSMGAADLPENLAASQQYLPDFTTLATKAGTVEDLVSGYGPSVTVPSVATKLALWLTTPPPKIHTPASWAARTTACAASPTAGSSSSGKVIAPSSNEIRYRVIP